MENHEIYKGKAGEVRAQMELGRHLIDAERNGMQSHGILSPDEWTTHRQQDRVTGLVEKNLRPSK